MKIAGLATRTLLGLVVAGSVALADGPATRPAARSSPEAQSIRQALRDAGGVRSANPLRYSDQEWSQMLQFLGEYSPARYQVLQNIQHQLSPNNPIRQDLIRKWRNYNFMHENIPAVADVYLKRIKTEDDLFALIVQARSTNASTQGEFRELIRGKVAALVQLGFDEQNIRIAKLQQLLKEERSKLVAAQERQDRTINQRTEAIMNRIHPIGRGTTRPTVNPESDRTPPPGLANDESDTSPQTAANESVDGVVRLTGAVHAESNQSNDDSMKPVAPR